MSLDITRVVISWKSVLYESREHRAELKLSRHLPNCSMFDLFRDFSLCFFFQTKVCLQARRRNWRYYNRWVETKILNEKTKWTVRVLYFEGFHTQLDRKLTYGNKIKHSYTCVVYIIPCSKAKQNKTGMLKNIAKLKEQSTVKASLFVL